MNAYKIAVLPGDGIGPEVMQEAVKILGKISNKYKIRFEFVEGLVGGAAYEQYKEHLPEETLKICRDSQAILFGSVGGPVSEQHLPKWKGVEKTALLGLRKEFNLYANLRPAKLYPCMAYCSALRPDIAARGFDILTVRELTGGIYFGEPKGRDGSGDQERAFDTMVYTRAEIKRIARIGFEAARGRRKKLTSADKANVLETMVFWREVVEEVAREYPDVEYEPMYIDNAAMQIMKNPDRFDVILCGNLFGDILSDESSAVIGSLGMLASASLDDNDFGLYEPGGGSAQDIAGMGIANPIAQVLSAAMMLEYSFHHKDAARDIEEAVRQVLEEGYRTVDIMRDGFKQVDTKQMGDLICKEI